MLTAKFLFTPQDTSSEQRYKPTAAFPQAFWPFDTLHLASLSRQEQGCSARAPCAPGYPGADGASPITPLCQKDFLPKGHTALSTHRDQMAREDKRKTQTHHGDVLSGRGISKSWHVLAIRSIGALSPTWPEPCKLQSTGSLPGPRPVWLICAQFLYSVCLYITSLLATCNHWWWGQRTPRGWEGRGDVQ